MNKVLTIIRIILLLLVCFFDIYIYCFEVQNLVSYGYLLYLLLLGVIMVLTIKDIIKKNSINNNSAYTFIFILSFLIISYVFYRVSFDTSLFFNKYNIDSYNSTFIEYKILYLKQNMIYFNAMLILLLVFRKINSKID